MSASKPTRVPGTPIGDLFARPCAQREICATAPSGPRRLDEPSACLCSDSDSDVMFPASPSSPTEENKPKPSCAPHLRDAYEFSEPGDSDAMEEFHCPINFDFCRQPLQPRASIGPCLEFASQPKSRACAKLMVRSGLRCCFCFKLKAACICLKASSKTCFERTRSPFRHSGRCRRRAICRVRF